ncbi:MAG: MFS transporter, partial [Anaerolineae bacterium]|nr:MFS transporter [Anaerolineae bacterium]
MTIHNTGTRTAAIAFIAFIGLGLTSGLLGLAWPSMQQQFNLPLDAVNVLYLVNTATYTLAGFYIGRIMARLGSGTALLIGSALLMLCMFGYALAPAWAVIIVVGLLSGLGSGIVDAGLNLYVAAYLSPRAMNWLHASFGLGVTIGP